MLQSKPKTLRTGQTIFNFLEWLHLEKNIPLNQSSRMADPFHISDEEIHNYYREYLELYKGL